MCSLYYLYINLFINYTYNLFKDINVDYAYIMHAFNKHVNRIYNLLKYDWIIFFYHSPFIAFI